MLRDDARTRDPVHEQTARDLLLDAAGWVEDLAVEASP